MKIADSRSLIFLLIGSLAAATVGFLALLGVFDSLELESFDLRCRLRGPRPVDHSDIILVVVDDQTNKDLPARWPYPRDYYAHLLANLRSAGVRLVVFDIQFTEPDYANPESDTVLATRVAAEAEAVILSGKVIVQTHGATRYSTLDKPIPVLSASGAAWGIVNDIVDPDGFTRQYSLFQPVDGRDHPSLALQAIRKLNSLPPDTPILQLPGFIRFGTVDIERYRRSLNTMLINYYGPPKTFPTYSLSNLMDDASFDLVDDADTDYMELFKDDSVFPPAVRTMLNPGGVNPFRDKVALIGVSLDELHDNKPTPFYGYGGEMELMPGVEIHGHALQNLIDGDFIHLLPAWSDILILLAVCLITALLVGLARPLFGLLITAGLVIVLLGMSYYFFVARDLWLQAVTPVAALFAAYTLSVVFQIVIEQREKRFIKGAFAHYLPEELVDTLVKDPEQLQLGGEERFITVLFSDIAGFTTISEKLTPTELSSMLNEYLTAMTRVVLVHKGIIDKFEGDAVMAEFGAPVYFDDHALEACRAAIEMQDLLEMLRVQWAEMGRPEIRIRIGINSGNMVVGNMGSDTVFDYTVLGDAVNLGSRLEGANKVYGTEIMISEYTYQIVKDRVVARELDLIRVKGKNEPVRVYELIGLAGQMAPVGDDVINLYLDGLAAYRLRDWEGGINKFSVALKLRPEDSPSAVYLERCRDYKENPPDPDWDGVYVARSK
ncbi:CHASE2 domain-containing protein [candidate division KSB1 bacterium]